jgi:hypothetical protein
MLQLVDKNALPEIESLKAAFGWKESFLLLPWRPRLRHTHPPKPLVEQF